MKISESKELENYVCSENWILVLLVLCNRCTQRINYCLVPMSRRLLPIAMTLLDKFATGESSLGVLGLSFAVAAGTIESASTWKN